VQKLNKGLHLNHLVEKPYDCIIIGGGVTGTATLYVLAKYSSVKRMLLIEQYEGLAKVNSQKDNNSQTLHFGDIETNYSAEKSAIVQAKTELTRRYIEAHKSERLFAKTDKMVIAVGPREVDLLEKRFDEIKHLFPSLRKIGRKEIAKIEPNVIKGRDPKEEIIALHSPDGYAVDFGKLAISFANNARKTKKDITITVHKKVWAIKKEGDLFRITTSDNKEYLAKSVVVAAGADSLLFAHKLGYAKHWILLPVAGSFYRSPQLLKGKVYTMQEKKLPFAAVHGDPDVANARETRFGPTAKVLPMMERHRYGSVIDFLRLFRFRMDATLSMLNIIRDPILFRYVVKNFTYDIPFLGTCLFTKQNVRKIIPSIRYSQVSYGSRLGGIRPQLVDTRKKFLEFGDAKVIGEKIIFDITPSPGASVCVKNGEENARKVVEFLGASFDSKKFCSELGTPPKMAEKKITSADADQGIRS
jgi:malate dehydrogenase (quinone)